MTLSQVAELQREADREFSRAQHLERQSAALKNCLTDMQGESQRFAEAGAAARASRLEPAQQAAGAAVQQLQEAYEELWTCAMHLQDAYKVQHV